MLGEPSHAELAAVLLVGDGGEDAGRRGRNRASPPTRRDRAGHDRVRRGEVQHVDRAASPQHAVDDLCGERIARPAGRFHRDDVGVPDEGEGRRGGVGASTRTISDVRPGCGSTVTPRDRHLRRSRCSAAPCRDSFPESGVPSLTHGIADQLLQQLGGLLREGPLARRAPGALCGRLASRHRRLRRRGRIRGSPR